MLVKGLTLFCLLFFQSAFSQNVDTNSNMKQLTSDERKILELGDLSTSRYIWGGAIGSYLGFGIGHAIQGTWDYKGKLFTGTQLGLLAIALGSKNEFCNGDGENCFLVELPIVAFVGIKVWEIVDLWKGVPSYMRQQKEIKKKVKGMKTTSYIINPVIEPVTKQYGLALTMHF